MRVIPARYGAFIAAKHVGQPERFGPMNAQPIDQDLEFWVPLHKLFDGDECLAELDLRVLLENHQINEKIGQIHRRFRGTGWQEPDILNAPFVITQGLSHWADTEAFAPGWLMPDAKQTLVEPAYYQGQPLSFMMPPNSGGLIHGRHRVRDDGSIEDLNDLENVDAMVKAGGYRALHYQDAMADGWVRAYCPQLMLDSIAAYSIIGAPDFFPLCGQLELKEWSSDPEVFPGPTPPCPEVWHTRGNPRSDVRFYINQSLEGHYFDQEDRGVTAIVSHPHSFTTPRTSPQVARAKRKSWLHGFRQRRIRSRLGNWSKPGGCALRQCVVRISIGQPVYRGCTYLCCAGFLLAWRSAGLDPHIRTAQCVSHDHPADGQRNRIAGQSGLGWPSRAYVG